MTRIVREDAFRSDHVSRVTIEHAPLGYTLHIRGRRFVATLNADTEDDYELVADVEFQGIELKVANHTDGDYSELLVMMPTEGEPEIVGQFGHTVYLPPDGSARFVADGTVTLPTGLFLRLVYHSVATSGPQPVIYLNYWIWEQ